MSYNNFYHNAIGNSNIGSGCWDTTRSSNQSNAASTEVDDHLLYLYQFNKAAAIQERAYNVNNRNSVLDQLIEDTNNACKNIDRVVSKTNGVIECLNAFYHFRDAPSMAKMYSASYLVESRRSAFSTMESRPMFSSIVDDTNRCDLGGWSGKGVPNRPERYKTQLCKNMFRQGVCKFGADCWFAHNSAELRTPNCPLAAQTTGQRFSGSTPHPYSTNRVWDNLF